MLEEPMFLVEWLEWTPDAPRAWIARHYTNEREGREDLPEDEWGEAVGEPEPIPLRELIPLSCMVNPDNENLLLPALREYTAGLAR